LITRVLAVGATTNCPGQVPECRAHEDASQTRVEPTDHRATTPVRRCARVDGVGGAIQRLKADEAQARKLAIGRAVLREQRETEPAAEMAKIKATQAEIDAELERTHACIAAQQFEEGYHERQLIRRVEGKL
jgi:hypothetical protein